MENIQRAEEKLDSLLRYFKTYERTLCGNDVACIRQKLEAILNSNSGLNMIDTAHTGIRICMEYWGQTPGQYTEVQQILRNISGHLDAIWEQRQNIRQELDEARQRIRSKITKLYQTTEEELLAPLQIEVIEKEAIDQEKDLDKTLKRQITQRNFLLLR